MCHDPSQNQRAHHIDAECVPRKSKRSVRDVGEGSIDAKSTNGTYGPAKAHPKRGILAGNFQDYPAVLGEEPQNSFVSGVGLPGERRGGIREEALLGECRCLLRRFGIQNFGRCDLDTGVAVCGGVRNFAQLGLLFAVLLPRSEDGFLNHGH